MATLNWTKTETGYKAESKFAEDGVFHAERTKSGNFELYDGTTMVREAHGVLLRECKAQAQQIADDREQAQIAAEAEAYANRKNPDVETVDSLIAVDNPALTGRLSEPEDVESERAHGCSSGMHGDPGFDCTCPDPDTLPTHDMDGGYFHAEPCPACVAAYEEDMRNEHDHYAAADAPMAEQVPPQAEYNPEWPPQADIDDYNRDQPTEADLDYAYGVHGGSRVGGPLVMPSAERRTFARYTPPQEQRRSLTINRVDWGQLRA